MVTSNQVSLGATPVLVVPASMPANPFPRPPRSGQFPSPSRYVAVKNIGPATVYIGNASVSTETGVPIVAGGLIPFWLYPVDELWGVTAVDDAVVSFLESGTVQDN